MALDKLAQAELIKEVITIRDRCDAILDLLIPDDGSQGEPECPHPPDQIEDIGTMGEDEYVCRRCGKTQHVPFHSIEE
jgi:hypothetical protein